jgi:hypothetical protein
MSLVKQPTMSDAKIAANQANSQKSTGPVTPEGLQRVRLGRLQHGLYVPDPREVLTLLGEDHEEFDRYEQALLRKWPPSDDFEEKLVRRIARNSWRLDRSGRVQESAAAQEVLALELARAVAGDRQQQRLRDCLAAIDTLLEMNRKGDLSDLNALTPAYDRIYEPYADEPPARAKEVFDLLCRLSPPLQIRCGVAPAEACLPPPPERARRSARLTEMLESERAALHQWDAIYRMQHVEITPTERQARMGPVQPNALAMIRQEESLARQLERDVRFMLDLKAREERMSGKQSHASQPEGVPAAKSPRAASMASQSDAQQSSQTTDAA